jgi:uncharacterized RDD family membrane protein YckC
VAYLIALHQLIVSKTAAAIAVVAVVVFVLINFALVIIPFGLLLVRPQGTEETIRRFKDSIVSHERQIAAVVALLAGAFMVITGTLRVLS